MKYTSIGFLCLTSLVFGAQKTKPPVSEEVAAENSYDSDLFRKDTKVIFANASLLYWTVNEGALDYAIKMKQPAWGPTTDAVGHYKVANFDWDPGLRVNLGYFNAPHYWDCFFQYTFFRSRGHDEAHAPKESDRFLNGTFPQPDPVASEPLAHAHSDIELRHHLLQATFTRRFHPNPHLRIRLFGSGDVVWFRQNWEIDYRDVVGNKSHLHNQWHYTGAGIRIGLLLDWFLGKGGFYLTAQTSAACFAGDFHNVSKQTSTFSGGGFNPALPLRNAHYHDVRLVPNFQFVAGPSWQQAFDNFRTEIMIGYELNLWTNLHEVIRTTSGTPTAAKLTTLDTGMIGMQGATLRFNLDF